MIITDASAIQRKQTVRWNLTWGCSGCMLVNMTDADIKIEISDYVVKNAPPKLYYIPNFITETEENALLQNVYAAPKPKWTQLLNRRLQNWGGLPHAKGMVAEDLPKWLLSCTEKISNLGVFGDNVLNHVLVNEYEAGQGIMPHEDGPLFYPIVSTISLGSQTLLDFYYHPTQDQTEEESEDIKSLESRHFVSMLLEPRSLILVSEDMYKLYLHGIAEKESDIITEKVANINMCQSVKVGDELKRSTRVSLTIRHVNKTLRAKLLLGKR